MTIAIVVEGDFTRFVSEPKECVTGSASPAQPGGADDNGGASTYRSEVVISRAFRRRVIRVRCRIRSEPDITRYLRAGCAGRRLGQRPRPGPGRQPE